MRASAFVIALSLALLATAATADVPGLINYQGTLTDQYGVALDTTVDMTFSIYSDSTGGSLKWTETQSSVEVSHGIFSVLLGSVNAISDTVFNDTSRWLSVQVESDPEMQPRERIASVAYALVSGSSSGGSDGDWTISDSDMYSAVLGNVGIGTTSPTAKLDVQGTLTVGEDDTGYDVNFYGAQSGSRFFWDQDKMALRAGIDTDGSHWAADSLGDYSVALGYDAKAKGSGSTALGHTTTASGYLATAMGVASTASAAYATAMGRQTEASATGATAMGAFTQASGSNAFAVGDHTTASGEYSTAMGRYITAQGDYSFGIGLDATTRTITQSNTMAIMGGKVGIGNITPTAPLTIETISGADLQFSSTVYDADIKAPCPLLIWTTNNSSLSFITNNSYRMLINGSGNVGIGTITPSSKLHVEGTIKVDQKIQAEDSGGLELATDEGTTRLFIHDNGNVGIGLTTPNRSLYIAENVNGLSYPLKIDNYNGNWNVAAGLLFSAGGNGTPGGILDTARGKGALVYEYTGSWNRGKFHFLQNTATDSTNPELADAVMTIQNNGNVGIGTTSPASKLEVAGTVHSTSSGFKFPDATTQTTAAGAGAAYWAVSGSDIYTTNSGHVGIGTSSPQRKLHLYDAADPAMILDTGGTDWYIGLDDSDNDKLMIGNGSTVGTSTRLTITTSGSVGIGTATPGYKLDVAGDINTSGDIRKAGGAYIYPDYVFEPSYELMSLGELRVFVSEQRHLPGIPSSEEVKEDGVKLFEQNLMLLEKLEEAYLYILQLEERIQKLEEGA